MNSPLNYPWQTSEIPGPGPAILITNPDVHETLREIRAQLNRLEAMFVRLRIATDREPKLNTTQDELGNDLS